MKKDKIINILYVIFSFLVLFLNIFNNQIEAKMSDFTVSVSSDLSDMNHLDPSNQRYYSQSFLLENVGDTLIRFNSGK